MQHQHQGQKDGIEQGIVQGKEQRNTTGKEECSDKDARRENANRINRKNNRIK